MNSLPTVNIASREFKADPYPFYARLRAEAPVYRTVLPDKQPAWLITRYDDVFIVLKDEQRFVKDKRAAGAKIPWVPPMFKAFERNLLDLDGADHARLRGLIHKAFTPRMIEQMRQRVQVLSNELLDSAERKRQFDLIRDYALPVPMTIISEILGVPPKDRLRFARWSKDMISGSASSIGLVRAIPNLIAIARYLRWLIKERRAIPQDDLITALVQAEEAGDQLSEDELVSMVFVLLVAGHETTVNLIGSGALALLENPDQMRLLRQNPELIKTGIEELLRYVSPVEQATERYARETVTLHEVTIPRGGLVYAVLASANRDEQQFEHADKLDVTRDARKHLAFGQGVHYCVGAPLARLEGQIAISTLIQRMPNLRLAAAPNNLRWRSCLTVRGLEALPVAL
jgi:cytochrome P450